MKGASSDDVTVITSSADTPRRFARLLEAGLSFRWLRSLPEKLPGKRRQRRDARRRPRQERLRAETAERLRRLQLALDADRIRRTRKAAARKRGRKPVRRGAAA